MQDEALRRFREKAREGDTFQIGGDASVTSAINQPIAAFVFNQAGLMGLEPRGFEYREDRAITKGDQTAGPTKF
jgi:hypothetical protein